MESSSAGGGEWHGYLTGSHDRGKVTSTGRTTNQYWSPWSSSTGHSRDQYCSLFAPQRCLYLSTLHGVISLPTSGASPVRYTSLPDLHEWSSSQLWCGEYPAIPLGKRSQVAYMYIGKGDEFAQGVWWINNLLYLCTRN